MCLVQYVSLVDLPRRVSDLICAVLPEVATVSHGKTREKTSEAFLRSVAAGLRGVG